MDCHTPIEKLRPTATFGAFYPAKNVVRLSFILTASRHPVAPPSSVAERHFIRQIMTCSIVIWLHLEIVQTENASSVCDWLRVSPKEKQLQFGKVKGTVTMKNISQNV